MELINALPAVTTIVIFVLIVWLIMRQGDLSRNKQKKALEEYLRLEQEANFARKKSINPELFVIVNIDDYPKGKDSDPDELRRLRENFVKSAGKTMIRFSERPTNREIKLNFGASNFEAVVMYEENFERLIHAGNKWAEGLIKHGQKSDAKIIIEGLLALGSDFKKTQELFIQVKY